MAGELNYTIIDYEGIKIIKLLGHISTNNKNDFENLIERYSERNNIIINMQEVDIITSAGLDSLIKISVNARKGKLKLMLLGVREEFRKLMEEMDIRQHFTLIDSIEEGQSRIQYS